MDSLWQTLIGGLSIAAISGITVIAYRHPAGYIRMYVPLLCVIGGAWAIWFIYELGFALGFSAATLEAAKLNPNTFVNTPSQVSLSFWLYVVPVILYAYFSFLRLLPLVIDNEKSAPDQDKE